MGRQGRGFLFTTALVFGSLGTPAFGFAPAGHEAQRSGLERADGAPTRTARATQWHVPRAAEAAWQRFSSAHPDGAWRALWDADTGVPLRIFGAGPRFEGATKDPAAAEAAARALIFAHLDLLAPGSSPGDLELVANHYDPSSGLRAVGFRQRFGGLEVRGGQVSVRIRADRVFVVASEALPTLEQPLPAAGLLPDADALALARAWMADTLASAGTVASPPSAPFLLPVFGERGAPSLRRVQEVVLDYRAPFARWSVFLDASTGEPVAREQTLRFFSADVRLDVPDRSPTRGRRSTAAATLDLTVDGDSGQTSPTGVLEWSGANPASVTAGMQGARVRVISATGDARFELQAVDGGRMEISAADDARTDAQISAYHMADATLRYVERIAPEDRFVANVRLETNVNLNDTCNAFSDGRTINFFEASARCENTARLADVVAHELGHAVHAQALIRGVGAFDGAMSEGASDYLAATMTNDSGMGRGFFFDDNPLRELDPADREARWPTDVSGDTHTTGLIFGGAMWDLRTALVLQLGPQTGVEQTNQLWYQALQRSTDIPSTYVEVLAADDDDGDLSNGTPNYCAIVDAFEAHGLADPDAMGSARVGRPALDGRALHLPVARSALECPGAGVAEAQVFWRRRAEPMVGGRIPLAQASDRLQVELPSQPAGSVLQYRVEVVLESGEVLNLPSNPAAPWYEAWFGEVETLYCTDFEADPFAAGWTHSLLEGTAQEGADDWLWGEPAGTPGSGDPAQAASGGRVVGNDLGGGNYNGRYQPEKSNQLLSPVFDASGYDSVRLQYKRWLTVEDAQYDQAEILADGVVVWRNLDTGRNGETHHQDAEWRFHDVDLSAQAADGQVQVAFRITSDGGLEMGGWTLDDLCIVGVRTVVPMCGNGVVESGEACDDGNDVPYDGCESDCSESPKPACGDGRLDADEMCDDGNLVDGDGCERNCTFTPDPNPLCEGGGEPPCELGVLPLDEQGCGCTASGERASSPGALFGLLLLGLVFLRRR